MNVLHRLKSCACNVKQKGSIHADPIIHLSYCDTMSNSLKFNFECNPPFTAVTASLNIDLTVKQKRDNYCDILYFLWNAVLNVLALFKNLLTHVHEKDMLYNTATNNNNSPSRSHFIFYFLIENNNQPYYKCIQMRV